MDRPAPILVQDLFPEVLEALLALLNGLSLSEWESPTAAAGWTVKDIAAHLLAGDIGKLSRRRDGYRPPGPSFDSPREFTAYLNGLNQEWVQAMRRISPPLLCGLLRWTGDQVAQLFLSLDPFEIDGPVSWAGPDPAPVWLDVAREFTERWHHQQHIREAVRRPGLRAPRYLGPVLDTFVRALPYTYRNVEAPEGASVALTISGPSGGAWSVVREPERWQLYRGKPAQPEAEVELPEEIAWRLFTKGIPREAALAHAVFAGDLALGQVMLETISIIA